MAKTRSNSNTRTTGCCARTRTSWPTQIDLRQYAVQHAAKHATALGPAHQEALFLSPVTSHQCASPDHQLTLSSSESSAPASFVSRDAFCWRKRAESPAAGQPG